MVRKAKLTPEASSCHLTVADFDLMFQNCSKSPSNWQRRGSFLSESRSPELA